MDSARTPRLSPVSLGARRIFWKIYFSDTFTKERKNSGKRGQREKQLHCPNQAIAAKPLLSTIESSFSAEPIGLLRPRSHWLMESLVTPR
uniref:Uncharacterized protein n=1 Tax=Candidatus Kentrum sp. LPFa TaxID=2126335 RepID=A0A450W8Q9_9GAMM|nr:MAG: hypothetical protein BECKLPF1236B_GA0070989_10478 [Candidatus Kentron sp. LPFa]